MKKIFFYIFSLSVIIFLQVSSIINKFISINKVIPDFLLVYLILISFYSEISESLTIGFLSGLILDFFSSTLFGFNSFSYVVIIFLFDKIKRLVNLEKISFLLLIVFISLILKLFFIYFFGFLFKEIFVIYKNVLLNYLINIIYTLLIAPFIYYLLSFIIKKADIYKNQIFF